MVPLVQSTWLHAGQGGGEEIREHEKHDLEGWQTVMGQPARELKEIEHRAYARGYQAGVRWPLHRPPVPPEPVIAELVEALRALRDAIDNELSKFEENDPLNRALSPFIDRADHAQRGLALWLMDGKIP